jgi:hypothetical protein
VTHGIPRESHDRAGVHLQHELPLTQVRASEARTAHTVSGAVCAGSNSAGGAVRSRFSKSRMGLCAKFDYRIEKGLQRAASLGLRAPGSHLAGMITIELREKPCSSRGFQRATAASCTSHRKEQRPDEDAGTANSGPVSDTGTPAKSHSVPPVGIADPLSAVARQPAAVSGDPHPGDPVSRCSDTEP